MGDRRRLLRRAQRPQAGAYRLATSRKEHGVKGALISLLIALFLSGPAWGAELEGTLKKITKDRIITLGYRGSAPPFSFLGTDYRPAGYSVDLCQRIVTAIQQDLGLPNLVTRWFAVSADDRIAMLVNGNIDIECGSTTHTLSREEQVDFTPTTFVGGAGLLATAASGIKGVADLRGKRVGVIPGTTTEKVLGEALKKANVTARVVDIKDSTEAAAALERGYVEAYASDRIVLMGLVAKAKDPSKFRLADEYLSQEHYALMVRRGDPAFRLAVNRVLSRLYRSGEIVPIYEKWFGPMGEASSALKALYQLHGIPE
jgi:ABC-type amino acid transport substrate-binding protein